MPHLWEVDHPYYCEETNFYTTADKTVHRSKTWAEFAAEQGADDMDLNLVFRWDWKAISWDDKTDEPIHPEDDYYRGYELYLFFLNQRKGIYRCQIIEVCRADEDAVIAYLRPRWLHLAGMWEPVSQAG